MVIKFGDDADTSTMGAILSELVGWTLKVEYSSPGFPEQCSIESTNRDVVVICDVNEIGKPLPNSLYHVGYDEITSITII
jgi:hypothetical protein